MSLYVIKNNGFYAEYYDDGSVCYYDYLQIICCANVMYGRRLILPLSIDAPYNVRIHYNYTDKKAVVYK